MMQVDTSTVRLLMEIGYIAAGYGLVKEAEAIFAAVKASRPDSELPLVGLAVTRLNAGQNDEAIRLLRDEALKINADSDIARAFLGLALKQAGLASESRAFLQTVVDNRRDMTAVALAEQLLKSLG